MRSALLLSGTVCSLIGGLLLPPYEFAQAGQQEPGVGDDEGEPPDDDEHEPGNTPAQEVGKADIQHPHEQEEQEAHEPKTHTEGNNQHDMAKGAPGEPPKEPEPPQHGETADSSKEHKTSEEHASKQTGAAGKAGDGENPASETGNNEKEPKAETATPEQKPASSPPVAATSAAIETTPPPLPSAGEDSVTRATRIRKRLQRVQNQANGLTNHLISKNSASFDIAVDSLKKEFVEQKKQIAASKDRFREHSQGTHTQLKKLKELLGKQVQEVKATLTTGVTDMAEKNQAALKDMGFP